MPIPAEDADLGLVPLAAPAAPPTAAFPRLPKSRRHISEEENRQLTRQMEKSRILRPPDYPTAYESALRTFTPEEITAPLPYLGGATGAIAFPPAPTVGAAVGGGVGEALRQGALVAGGKKTTLREAAGEVGKETLAQGAYEAGGRYVLGPALRGAGALAGRGYRAVRGIPPPPPQVTEGVATPAAKETLVREGIQLTGGEQAGPGFVREVERRASQTGLGLGPAAKFLRGRQAKVTDWANRLAQQLLPESAAPTEARAISRFGVGETVQTRAGQEMQRQTGETLARRQAIPEAVGATPSVLPVEAGDAVIAAVRNQHEAIDALERVIYEDIRNQVTESGAVGTWQTAGGTADKMLTEARAALAAGRSNVTSDVTTLMERMSPIEARRKAADSVSQAMFGEPFANLPPQFQSAVLQHAAYQEAVQQTLQNPIPAMMDARTAAQELLRQYTRQRIESPSIGALKQLVKSMTDDIERVLPTNLAKEWREARLLTVQQKRKLFNSAFVKRMFRSENPLAGERVIREMMTKGRDADLAILSQILRTDANTLAKAQRASMDVVINSSTSSRKALKFLDERPGLRHVLGDKLPAFRTQLTQAARAEEAESARIYQAFVKRTARAQDPERVLIRILKSPEEATRLRQLIGGDAGTRARVARDMYERLLDSSTSAGTFGAPRAVFDPVKFSQVFREAEASLGQFVEPETLAALREFSDGMSALTLSSKSATGIEGTSIAGAFGTLGEIGAIGSGIGALTGSLFGPWGTGAGAGVGYIISPRVFVQMSLHPTGARLLAEGAKLRVGTSAFGPWLARVEEFIRREVPRDTPPPPPTSSAPDADLGLQPVATRPQKSQQLSPDAQRLQRDLSTKRATPTDAMLTAKEGKVTPAELNRVLREQRRRKLPRRSELPTTTIPMPPPTGE